MRSLHRCKFRTTAIRTHIHCYLHTSGALSKSNTCFAMSLGKYNIKNAKKKNIALLLLLLICIIAFNLFLFLFLLGFEWPLPRLMQKACAHQIQVGSMLVVSPGYIV